MNTMMTRRLFTGLALSLFAGGAAAHHGWSWAEADQIELTGTVKTVVIAPPHPTIDLTTTGGEDWHIELGNRSKDPGERRLKAVRVTIGAKVYDIYPERINKS